MTNKSLLLVAGLSIGTLATAQNQSWTATDIEGNDISIQSLLDEGKTVLVDISAHWCGPCWAWHNSEIMQKLYTEFGPNGTNDLEIIWVDGDAASSMALLEGGSGSQGDWLEGTVFPVIGPNGEGNALADIYNISAYPTLFMHCPGANAGVEIARTATWQTFLNSWKNACPAAFNNGVNDATMFEVENGALCPGEHPFGELYNQGSAALTSATVELKEGGNTLQTVNWTGNLAPFTLAEVEFNDITVSGPTDYTTEVSNPNGGADANPAGNSQLVSFEDVPQSLGTAVTLKVRTDNYCEETTWKLYNSSNVVVQQGGPYTAGSQDNMEFSYTWTLSDQECYTFKIYDAYGDGICCAYGNGYYKLTRSWDNSIFLEGAQFGGQEDKGFVTEATLGVQEVAGTDELSVFPNPTTGIVNITFNMTGNATVDVFNVLGERVITRTMNATGTKVLDMSSLTNGVYYMNVTADGASTTRKITLNK